MSEQQPRLTAEQIFKKSLAYQHISENFDKYVHYAMQQYADQETAQLRQELEDMISYHQTYKKEFGKDYASLTQELERMKAQRDKGAELLRLLQMDGGVNNDLEDTINTFLSSLDK